MKIIWYTVPEKWKYQKKRKKTPEDIIILHKCIKNHHHRLHCSWDMTCEGCDCYFSFWTVFSPYPPPPPHPLASPNSSKNESFIKMKKPPESIYTSAPKLIIICYTVPEISAFEIKVLSMLAIKCWGKFRIFQFALAMRHQKKEPKTYQKPLYITSTMASPYLSISPRTMIWFNTWYYLFYLYHIVYL